MLEEFFYGHINPKSSKSESTFIAFCGSNRGNSNRARPRGKDKNAPRWQCSCCCGVRVILIISKAKVMNVC